MTINSVSSSSYMNFSNYRTTGTYGSDTSTSYSSQQLASTEEASGRPDGPPPPPPPSGSSGASGPDVDSDDDGLWSSDELDDFAASALSEFGVEIDTESILSTYDTDGDGSINSSEQVSMAKNNAFNLPSPQDMMQQMRGFSTPPNIKSSESSTSSYSLDSDDATESIVQQFLNAYNAQNESLYSDLFESTVSFDI